MHSQNNTQLPNNQTLGGSGKFHLSETQARLMAQPQYSSQPTNEIQGTGSAAVSSPVAPTPAASTTTKKGQNKQSSSKSQTSGSGTGGGGVPFKTMELAPASRRKKRKLPEEKLPSALLPESVLYTELLQLEAKVDAALARKKTDIQESVKMPPYVQKTLRIFVFNTFANQPLEIAECKSFEPPTWSLKIIGKILEDGGDGCDSIMSKCTSHPKLSSFFKKITIYLDQNFYPDNHVILWENSRSPVLHEGFEVKRKGDKEFTAIIRLEMNYIHEKFKLSVAHNEALGLEVETRARIMTALWHYVKVKKLQDPNDPAIFNCDPPLRKVFGEEKVKFAVASQKLTHHLSSLQPIHLEHKIKLSGNNPSGNMCYDVLVDIPFPSEKDMSAFLDRMDKCREIDDYDNSIVAAMKKINEHRHRRALFLGFSQSPAEFINTLIASQYRDLKVVGGDAIRNAEKELRSDFFNQPW